MMVKNMITVANEWTGVDEPGESVYINMSGLATFPGSHDWTAWWIRTTNVRQGIGAWDLIGSSPIGEKQVALDN